METFQRQKLSIRVYIKYREAIVSFCIVRRTNHEFFHVTLVATLLEAMQCTHGRFYLSVLTVLRSAFSSPHRSTWSYLFVGSFPPLFLSLLLPFPWFFLPSLFPDKPIKKYILPGNFSRWQTVAFSLSSKMLEISFNVFWFTKSRI